MRIEIPPWHLRPFCAEDLDTMVKYSNNLKVSSKMPDHFPHPYQLEDGMKWLSCAIDKDPICEFAIANDDHMIGCVGIQPLTDVYSVSAELGYWVAEPFWGQNIATLALLAASDYAMNTLQYSRLQARVFSNNPASARVLEKAGFVQEAILKKSVRKNATLLDQWIYARFRK
ncbi:MAG TPA: N-acetyltransferase [Myxococcales bacterium]|nr:N-acetyltransferase [Myxococcales bacterium]